MSSFWRDWTERLLWTLAEVGIAAAIVAVGELDGAWVVPITTGLMALKGIAARHLTNPETASLP